MSTVQCLSVTLPGVGRCDTFYENASLSLAMSDLDEITSPL